MLRVRYIQAGEPERHRRRCEDNIKMDVTEACCVNLRQINLRIDF